jgi:DNA-binding transcriptional LysR family regulator
MSVTIPSLNWLRVFEAAARHESFARAANELNMSAAAVSQQVRALEERLKRPLFRRYAHSVQLTEAGRSFLPSVQQALDTVQSATIGLFGAVPVRQVFVQSEPMFAQGLLARGLREFCATNPDIAISLNTFGTARDGAANINDLEIVFGHTQTLGRDSDRLIGETLYPVAPLELAAQISAPSDLLDHRLINVGLHRAGWHQLFDHLGLPTGNARFIFTEDTVTAMALAREGMGIALARAPASDQAMRDAGLVPCLNGISIPGRDFYFLVSSDHTGLRPAARAFRNWLLSWCH